MYTWTQFHQCSTYKFFVRMYILAAFTTYVLLEKAAKMTFFVRKKRAKNVDEIDTWCIWKWKARLIPLNLCFDLGKVCWSCLAYRCQFHQHFYVQIFCTNGISAAFSSYILALAKNLYEKYVRLMWMKLTA